MASSPAEATLAAYQDILTLPPPQRQHARYLWWPRGGGEQDATNLLKARAQLNFLSDQGAMGDPVLVAPGLVRFHVADYGFDKKNKLQVWEKFTRTDVYFHARWKFLADAAVTVYYPAGDYDGKYFPATATEKNVKAGDTLDRPAPWANPPVDIGKGIGGFAQDELRRHTYSEAPILYGDWFLVQTARQLSIRNVNEGTGYYDFLGIKNRQDFFRLAGLDEQAAIQLYQEWRAVIAVSDISQQNRQLVLLRGTTGLVWGTLDVFQQKDRGVAKENLRRGEFQADAEEWIAHLANGLPVTGLFKGQDGTAQETAPDKIGGNDSPFNIGRDPRIHVGTLTCLGCHGTDKDYLKPFDDWVRKSHRAGRALLQDPDKRVELELRSNYLRPEIYRHLDRDREDFAFAFRQLTTSKSKPKGMSIAEFTRLYYGWWNQYVEYRDTPITATVAARELGVPPEKFLQALRRYNDTRGGSDLMLGDFLGEPPGQLTRLEWEASYAYAQSIVLGLAIPEWQVQVPRGAEKPKEKTKVSKDRSESKELKP